MTSTQGAALAAVNESNRMVVSDDVRRADTFVTRLVGLLGRRGLSDGEGLWILPCRGIHTMGMRFPIDALFLDPSHRVVAMKESLPPWRTTPFISGAVSVLELPAGRIGKVGVSVGDQIAFVATEEESR